MERALSLLATAALVGCFATGYLALRQFAGGDDLTGLLLSGSALVMGLIARRILGVRGDEI